MKVFTLLEDVAYEASYLIGVYSTLEQAQRAALMTQIAKATGRMTLTWVEETATEHPFWRGRTGNALDNEYIIEQWEVQS